MSSRRQIGSEIEPVGPGHLIEDKYELVEIAGVGGMATVWRAIQHGPGRFRRLVAVKHMHPHLAVQGDYREMFFEEARVGAVLSDPNLARVQDFIEVDEQLYLIIEWVEGIDLASYVRYAATTDQETRWELISAVGIGMLRGLAAAHEHTDEDGAPAPVLHRDVSPHNVLISVKGPARLIDFGLALAADRMSAPTPPGTAKGKLAYLSPEVARGEPPTPASDQFAAASVLWESLVGRKLFFGNDEAEVFRALATAKVEPLSRYRPDVPRPLQKVIARALEADPADRFPSARAMAHELGGVLKQAQIDIYALLSETVLDARETLEMGGRTQAPPAEGQLPEEESQVAIPLLLKSAWRKVRSAIPFLGGNPRPRKPPSAGRGHTPTPTSEVRRRARASGVIRLAPGDEADTEGPRLRLLAGARERTPSDPVIQLEVIDGDDKERLELEIPGQVAHFGNLITALSREPSGEVLLRVSPVRIGALMPMFPYVPVRIGELTLEVTGVGDSKVFVTLSRDGGRSENLIVAVSGSKKGVVSRTGYRITFERLTPPWVTVRVDELNESEPALQLGDNDIIEG